MHRVVPLLLGSALAVLLSCSGPAEPQEESNLQQSQAGMAVPAEECPWASSTDPSCAVGVSEKACSNGTGKCRVSGSLGCTCVKNTVAQPAPDPVIVNAVVAPVEDKTKKVCPWASAEDSSCAVGVSETACNNGTGKCRVSGSLGCTCVAN